jgi:hypothetical protein
LIFAVDDEVLSWGEPLEGGTEVDQSAQRDREPLPNLLSSATEQTRGDGGRKVVPVGVHPRFLNSIVKGVHTPSRVENLDHQGNGIFGIRVRELG